MVFRDRVRKAVAEVELSRMAAALALSRECRKSRLRPPFGDRDGQDASHLEEFADVRFGFLDAGVSLAADAEGRPADRDW